MTGYKNGQLMDVDTAMRLLEEVVAEKGADYKYHSGAFRPCRYVHEEDNQPGCLVGCVLHRYGVPLAVLERWEGLTARLMAPQNSPVNARPHLLTYAAASVLDSAQGVQDVGRTWGEALEGARRKYGRIKEVENGQ